jgi:quercetin dioxygenase-like cupin family protein
LDYHFGMSKRIILTVVASGLILGRAMAADALLPTVDSLDPRSISIVPVEGLSFTGRPGQAQLATVFGDPGKPGLYGMVIRWPPHTTSRPHSHPFDRFITVLSGTWWVATGAHYDQAAMVPIIPGSFVTHHAGEIHYDGTHDDSAMIYVVGMGPATLIDREQK